MRQRGFILLPIIIIIILISSLGYFIYLNSNIRKSSQNTNQMISTPTSKIPKQSETPIPTSIITEGWLRYSNTVYGFSLQYPTPDSSTKVTDSNSLFEIDNPSGALVRIEPIKTSETDPKKWWQSQQIESYTKKPIGCFKIDTDDPAVRQMYLRDRILDKFGNNIIILENGPSETNNTPVCYEPSVIMFILPHGGKLFKVIYDNSEQSVNILSTFEFK